MNRTIPVYLILLLSLCFGSCASADKFALLQNVSNTNETKEADFQVKLQPDDLLMIMISAENPIIAQPYNLSNVSVATNNETAAGLQRLLSYQIDQLGTIQLPGLGIIKAAGKTRNELMAHIEKLLEGKITNPVITIRILNFKISVQGEVNRPGTFPINSERVTLLEALSMAGDLTIYGKRDNILVIREENGIKSFQKVDITKGDFVNSPYYYLSQNDVIYVEPNKTRVNSSVIGPNVTVGLTALSLLITIIAITVR
ncbi:polysaccharide biosynthesis/export family protein [Flavobacterium gelidilacus]|uniref:polysaccharide biosynthesis/export family protein n=1 Tax=Flavobacterium gelidilacus TaxID=206041 RepID=UPI00041D4436|nr:polysaccharide biosynthesis/export family protein [Flavobacterium gelidilacus]